MVFYAYFHSQMNMLTNAEDVFVQLAKESTLLDFNPQSGRTISRLRTNKKEVQKNSARCLYSCRPNQQKHCEFVAGGARETGETPEFRYDSACRSGTGNGGFTAVAAHVSATIQLCALFCFFGEFLCSFNAKRSAKHAPLSASV